MADLSKGSGNLAGPTVAGRSFVLSRTFDGSETTVAAESNTIFQMPAGMLVTHCAVHCSVAQGETATLNVGDGSDADGFQASANLNSVASAQGSGALIATTTDGHFYATAGTVTMTPSIAIDTGKFTVVVAGFDMTDRAG